MSAAFPTNGHSTGASSTDEAIDLLYAWMPPSAPPAPLPEAALSLTLKGHLGGVEAMLTIRGQSPTEFKANLAAVKGLLDPVPAAQASSQPQGQGQPLSPQQHNAAAMHRPVRGFCPVHNVPMQENEKNGRRWWSHRTTDGTWCKGR
jgi:hypothetical protein